MIWFIILLGCTLRLINLNQSLWLDEATQVILSADSLTNIIFNHGADFHPPLSYVLMHFWLYFSSSEIWVRLLSVIFGLASIWMLYKFAIKVFNEKIALLSALLLAISPYHVYYSQEARMYSEATFFAVVSMFAFYNLLQKAKIINYLIYVLSTSALIYTHYDGLFLIAAQLTFLIFFKRNALKIFLKSLLLIVLLYLPWIPQLLVQLKGGTNIDNYLPGWRDVLSVSFYKAIPLTFFKFSFGRIDFDNTILYISIAAVTIFVFGLILYRGILEVKQNDRKIVILWFFLPVILAFLISFKIPINQPFRILYALPAYYILLALGIFSLNKFRKVFLFMIIGISISGLLLYYINPKYWREDWRGATELVLKNSSPDTQVIFAWPEAFSPYQYYGKNEAGLGVVKTFPAIQSEIERNLQIVEYKKEVYFFEYLQDLSDPNRFVQVVLKNKGFREIKVYNFNGVGFVYHYVKE